MTVRMSHPHPVYGAEGKVVDADPHTERMLVESGYAQPTGSAGAQPVYDPEVHNVEDVQKYLAGADEAERARVVAAERAGKNRSSIVG